MILEKTSSVSALCSRQVLKIHLDDKGFHCLKRSIPHGSRSKFVVKDAVNISFFGSNTVISCDEAEARNLLLYASHCPTVIAAIHTALCAAGLPLEKGS
jgi:hypothetical protein